MTRGNPRVQYERTYVLLPPDADKGWVLAAIEATWDKYRFTVGGSADDAGIGDLDARRVVAVNPQRWPGDLRAFFGEYYPGVEYVVIEVDTPAGLAEELEKLNPSSPPALLVGLHDEAGGNWMVDSGLEGCCLVHEQVQAESKRLDYSRLHDAGITVICRLNWGYADGTGTLPPWELLGSHLDALAGTMNAARGVDYFHFANEPNNAGEWPQGSVITSEYVIYAYNSLLPKLEPHVKIGPPPLDPYFGPGSDNGRWWRDILDGILRADALFLHTGKTQTNDPALVRSTAKFEDPPLRWQYLNMLATRTSLGMIPGRFLHLPVYVTECNPQRRSDGVLGWDDGNAAWVRECAALMREFEQVKGIAFYRYEPAGDQAGFGLRDRSGILAAIAEEVRR